MEDKGVAGADLPPTGGGGPPGRVHELGGLESKVLPFVVETS